MKRFNTTNIVAGTLTLMSIGILICVAYFVFTIKVLENWHISLPKGDIHVGDTIVVESTYVKTRDVSGEAVRYITCKNKNGLWVRYELNRATADRSSGKSGTGVALIIRRDIADVPTTCKIEIAIHYEVLPFRTVTQSQSSDAFEILPDRDGEAESPATTQNSPSQAPSVTVQGVKNQDVPSTNSTPTPQPQQSNNVQPTKPIQPTESPKPEKDAGIISGLIKTIKGIL